MASQEDNSEVKLIDFGLSKRYEIWEAYMKMTAVVGTPFYIAPEVLKGSYGKECDILSLGIMLYVFLCGYPPFEGASPQEILTNVSVQELPFAPENWDSISVLAKDLVSKLL